MPRTDSAEPSPGEIPAPRPGGATDNAGGASWMMLSVFTASVMTVAVKWAAGEVESSVIVVLRSAGGLTLCLFALIAVRDLRSELRFSAPWLHIWRGLLAGCATQFGFYTITELPLATSTVLFFTAPIFTAVMAIPLQGERVGVRRGGAIVFGFLGILIVMRPGAESFEVAILTGLASSLLFGLALLSSRGLANRDGVFASFISSTLLTLLIAIPFAAPVWSLPVSWLGWTAIGLVTATSLVRNMADIQAYRLAEAAILAPLSYLRLILLALAGYIFFSETPDLYTVIGGAVIIASALYIARREQLVRKRPPPPPLDQNL